MRVLLTLLGFAVAGIHVPSVWADSCDAFPCDSGCNLGVLGTRSGCGKKFGNDSSGGCGGATAVVEYVITGCSGTETLGFVRVDTSAVNGTDFARVFIYDFDGRMQQSFDCQANGCPFSGYPGVWESAVHSGTRTVVVDVHDSLLHGSSLRYVACVSGNNCCGVDCDDGDACTIDYCDGGSCVHEPEPCLDGNQCTTTACNPATGCLFRPEPCNDGKFCTIDSCDPSTGCVYAPRDCEDGYLCTVNECDEATNSCTATPYTGCDDGNACTDDFCEVTECVHEPAAPCEAGVIRYDPGWPQAVAQGCEVYTGEACQPESGCPVTIQDCDDGNPGTHSYCVGEGGAFAACEHSCRRGPGVGQVCVGCQACVPNGPEDDPYPPWVPGQWYHCE